jgi:hypothetical protein
VYSPFEIARVRHYCSVVKDVQAETNRRIGMYREALYHKGVVITAPIPVGGDLSELDAAAKLERGWWIMLGIGTATFIGGSAGLVFRTRGAANKVPEATAG